MGTRTELQDTQAYNVQTVRQHRFWAQTLTLATDAYPLDKDHAPVLFIDPNATTAAVLLPAITRETEGIMYFIFNTGTATESIALQTATGAALSPAVAVVGDEGVIVTNNGVAWRGIVGANT